MLPLRLLKSNHFSIDFGRDQSMTIAMAADGKIRKSIEERHQRYKNILQTLLKEMVDRKASDLHIKVKRPPLARIDGNLIPLKHPPLEVEDIRMMALSIMPKDLREKFRDRRAVDLGYSVPGVARFRTHIFQQRSSFGIVFRNIPHNVASIKDLDLPDILYELTTKPQGLVLVTGPTGSGKSTTLAALIKEMNETRNVHIVTIEDPIEFLFRDSKAAISQREVGFDTPSFKEALRNSLRQDPDVIMVGEMRDRETVETVLAAAETGHLVFSTLHTNDASQTIDRIIDLFPEGNQQQIRMQVASTLLAVISQQLVARRTGSGMIAACEILINSPNAKKLIREGNSTDLIDEIETSVVVTRMQSMNQSLLALLLNGVISKKEALRRSTMPSELELMLTKLFADKFKDIPESEGGDKDLSTADFSKIMKLMELEKSYNEQHVKYNEMREQKESVIHQQEETIHALEQEIMTLRKSLDDIKQRNKMLIDKAKGMQQEKDSEITRLRQELRSIKVHLDEKDAKGFKLFRK